jgi:3'-phosphoadenosine 5'-phosphosulfate sulfotransferase (PAPS reductase)/FAD synthetase
MTEQEYIKQAPTATIFDGLIKAKSVLNSHNNIMVSVSGGADSDNMIDIVEHLRPRDDKHRVTYVWFDTGVEMDATKRHLVYLENKYGITILREHGETQVAGAVRNVGYPFYSKKFSEYIGRLQKHNFQWEDEPFDVLLKKYPNCKAALRWWCNNWKDEPHKPLQSEIASAKYLKEFMIENPPTFSISNRCCNESKKKVGDATYKKYNFDIQLIGIRKAEGGARSTSIKSCMADGRHGKQYYPLFWWKAEDKTAFENTYDITHSDAYTVYGCKRTGCAGCPFAGRYSKELAMLHQYEPKLANAVEHIFAPAYEYANKYQEYKNMRKATDKRS